MDYYRGFNYKEMRTLIKDRRRQATLMKRLIYLIERKNSKLRRAMIEMTAKGLTNKQIAYVLGINKGAIDRLMRSKSSVMVLLKHDLSHARTYRNTYKHEQLIRTVVRKVH